MTGSPAIELVACSKRSLKLTTAGCARMFVAARLNEPKPWESNFACIGCRSGAERNGERHVPAAEAANAWKQSCTRCHVAGRRLVTGALCISCYNRDREVQVGYDRKGNRPRLTNVLHPADLVVVKDGTPVRAHFDRVLTAAEAMVATAKTAKGPILFGWPPFELEVGA